MIYYKSPKPILIVIIQHPTEFRKKVTIDKWAPVYHGKILDLFFSHNYSFPYFSIILSAETRSSIHSSNAC